MRSHRCQPLFFAVLAVLAAAPLCAQNGGKPVAAAAKPAILPVAVIDMEEAAAHTAAYKSGVERHTKMAEDFRKSLSDWTVKIDSLKLEIEILQPSPERLQKELEREALIGKRRLASKMFNDELERQQVLNDNKIYTELSDAVAELAALRGILMVLRKRAELSVADMVAQKLVRTETDGVRRQVVTNRARAVIYFAPELDLTQDLIKYLKAK